MFKVSRYATDILAFRDVLSREESFLPVSVSGKKFKAGVCPSGFSYGNLRISF
jgi:hypothetical protein